ncbi:MAG: hypothetical protein LBJ07_00895 [Actinomycetes bacterium]|jgi:predicted  nucleic acid-binding Zn-ribbon protein|nr:hypothetical protein [Actinomycetes bacterium]
MADDLELTKEAAALLKIQQVDLNLAEMNARLEQTNHKRKIAAAHAKLAEGEQRLSSIERAVEELDGHIANLQTEVEMVTEKIAGEQKKIESSADYRTVDALTAELESLAKRREKLEYDELQLMERKQGFVEARLDTQEKMNRLRELETTELEAYRNLQRKVQHARAELLTVREQLSALVAPTTLKRYEKIRDAKDGVGVARFEGGKCGACQVPVPASMRAGLEDADDFEICPTCKRLLIN